MKRNLSTDRLVKLEAFSKKDKGVDSLKERQMRKMTGNYLKAEVLQEQLNQKEGTSKTTKYIGLHLIQANIASSSYIYFHKQG